MSQTFLARTSYNDWLVHRPKKCYIYLVSQRLDVHKGIPATARTEILGRVANIMPMATRRYVEDAILGTCQFSNFQGQSEIFDLQIPLYPHRSMTS